VEVFFPNPVVTEDETSQRGQAIFPVTFSPQSADIPFTFIVETFDLTPPDARG